MASAWEIVIKHQTGKLHVPNAPDRFVRDCLQVLVVEGLSITLDHTLRLQDLPVHHRDPFDRILIAQAQAENLAILTNDPVFANYPAPTVW